MDGACFVPDRLVSRGEMAVWLWNMEGQPSAAAHSFDDVADAGQQQPVSWLSDRGITTGTTDTTFSPDNGLTRGQFAAFLWRLAGKPQASAHSFVDVAASWQQQPVSWLVEEAITTGTSPTMFSPDNGLTRGQLVTFLYRYKDEPTVTINPDNPTCTPTFKTVTAKWNHSCAVRTDDTITCWGDNRYGQADAPGGTFSAVSAGWGEVLEFNVPRSCGLRTDATITCWGDNDNGHTDAPGGTFSAVSAGSHHSCGLRTDATITCWGINRDGQTNAPGGTFSAVSVGSHHSCGLRTDATITCWGANSSGQADAPSA